MSIDVSDIERHETFYAAGGDVVLLATQSKDNDPVDSSYVAFRLDTSFLSLWSRHFSEMIRSTIHSTNSDEQYDGAAAIFMPDSASDVESLLNALLHGFELPVKLRAEALDTIGPVLSMATKYRFERLRAHIVQLLERDWPTTTAAWLKLDTTIREQHAELAKLQGPRWPPGRRPGGTPKATTTSKDSPATWADFAAPSAPTFIRFARYHDIPSILPAAFYSLFCQDKPYLSEYIKVYRPGPFRGRFRPLDMEKTHWERTWDVSRMSKWLELTHADIEVFVDMVHIVDNWEKRELVRHCECCKETMNKAEGDNVARRKMLSLPEIFSRDPHSVEMDPLTCLRELRRQHISEPLFYRSLRWRGKCRACADILEEEKEAAIHDLWDSFRALFGLPSLRMPFEIPPYEDPVETDYETEDSSNANEVDDGDD